jgi:hypothetical protein
VAVDSSDNVIVTGSSTGSGSGNDYATIKYSGDGVPLWTNRYDGPGNNSDSASAVVVDRTGNVIVTGSSGGSPYDCATIKYSSAGLPLWTNRFDDLVGGDDEANAVAVDRDGNVIVTGTCGAMLTIKYTCGSWPAMTCIPTNGTFQMRVDNVLQPGTLVIEASTNLTGWSPVFTNTTPTNVLFYTEPDAGNSPARFYRAFEFP